MVYMLLKNTIIKVELATVKKISMAKSRMGKLFVWRVLWTCYKMHRQTGFFNVL